MEPSCPVSVQADLASPCHEAIYPTINSLPHHTPHALARQAQSKLKTASIRPKATSSTALVRANKPPYSQLSLSLPLSQPEQPASQPRPKQPSLNNSNNKKKDKRNRKQTLPPAPSKMLPAARPPSPHFSSFFFRKGVSPTFDHRLKRQFLDQKTKQKQANSKNKT